MTQTFAFSLYFYTWHHFHQPFGCQFYHTFKLTFDDHQLGYCRPFTFTILGDTCVCSSVCHGGLWYLQRTDPLPVRDVASTARLQGFPVLGPADLGLGVALHSTAHLGCAVNFESLTWQRQTEEGCYVSYFLWYNVVNQSYFRCFFNFPVSMKNKMTSFPQRKIIIVAEHPEEILKQNYCSISSDKAFVI